MRALPMRSGYRLDKSLHASRRSQIYTASREADGRELVLKLYRETAITPADTRAKHELDVLARVAGPGVVTAIELIESVDGHPALALERVSGLALEQWVQTSPPSPESFLKVAIQVARTLSRVHGERLLHRDIHPRNILVNPGTLETCLIDFELARPLGAALQGGETLLGTNELAGSLPYIAPEATGRMNRGIDVRSDLYSLGCTLYFALTARPPFTDTDALVLIHAHMARMPEPPNELRPDLPVTLSRIVGKLLQKTPEDRYQTAYALERDLGECLELLERTGAIPADFTLGRVDAPHRPLFPRRLHGRDAETRVLQTGLAQAVGSSPNLILIGGAPGTGKSELVQSLRLPIVNAGGHLALGKLDQYRSDTPYSGFAQAFTALAQQLLSESDTHLAKWREELRQALGQIAGALVGLVPDLGFVLGEVPPLPKLGAEESRRRLAFAVKQFVRAAATRTHPLALCIDDLQWADLASLELLRELVLQSSDESLLVIGVYRDGEVSESHPLRLLIDELAGSHVRMQSIVLQPLDDDACRQMLAEALGRTPEQVGSLAACVARKTGNTPLLVQQFVYHMYDQGLIRFEAARGWSWNDDVLATADIPEDAVDILAAKIARLPEVVSTVLQLASCTRDGFDSEALARLCERSRDDIDSALFILCDEGLIAPSVEGFRFVHDRIREAARSLLGDTERARIHDQAARLLLARLEGESIDPHALEIGEHLIHAPPARDDAERLRRIEVHVAAGKVALLAGAPTIASRHLDTARAQLTEPDWATHGGLGFELYLHSAVALRQQWNLEGSLSLLDALVHRPLHAAQRAMLAHWRISTLALSLHPQALSEILATLRKFGIRWPVKPSIVRVVFAIWRTERSLRGPLDQSSFPPLDSGDHSAFFTKLLLLSASGSQIAAHSQRLLVLLMAVLLQLYRKHGQMRGLPAALASWASLSLSVRGNAKAAERYASAALDWMRRLPDPPVDARTEYMVQSFVYSMTRSRRAILEPLRTAANRLFEVGELEYGSYALFMCQNHMTMIGEKLETIDHEYQSFVNRLRGARLSTAAISAAEDLVVQEEILTMLNPRDKATPNLDLAIPAIETALRRHPGSRFGLGAIWLMVLTLRGRFEQVLESSRTIGAEQMGAFRLDVRLYRGIVAAALAEKASPLRALRLRGVLMTCLRELERWAKQNPDLEHMARALRAEHARVRKRPLVALSGYAHAAELAESKAYLHHAALLHERRASLLLALRRNPEALSEITRAASLYQTWGATTKVHELETLRASLRPEGIPH